MAPCNSSAVGSTFLAASWYDDGKPADGIARVCCPDMPGIADYHRNQFRRTGQVACKSLIFHGAGSEVPCNLYKLA